MKLLDRYIAKQILVTAFFAVGVLSLVLVFGNVFKQLLDLLVNHDVPIEYILSFMAYILPFSLTFTIPWGFLTAVLLVFGRLSAENELIALRSMGISIGRICFSLGIISVVCVAICLWINVDVAPKAQQQMLANQIAVDLIPQGTFVERIRAGGCGLGGVLTPTGVGTLVAEGKRQIEVNGTTFLLETALRAQFALVHAFLADYLGNLTYALTARNFNPIMAMAADTVIVTAEHIVPVGVIAPDHVVTPAPLVDYLITNG